MRIARKLSIEFDIVLAKELFSSFIVKGFDIHLIVSLGGDEIKSVLTKESRLHYFDKQMVHVFKKKTLSLNLYFY